MDFLNFGGRLRNAFAPKDPIREDPYKYRTPPFVGEMYPPRKQQPLFPVPDIRQGHGEALGQENDDSDVLSTIDRIYTPQHDYSDLYRQELDRMPQRQEPGKLRRVFGAMAGLGENGLENQERVKYAPYLRQLGDWETKMKAIAPGMTDERYENTNERMLAHQAVSDLLRERDIARRQKLDDANIEVRQQRAKAYADNLTFKQNHPKHDLKAIPGGNYVWFNPEDPSEDPIDTGIKSGTLSKLEEINLAQKNALQRIAAQGGEARKTEEVREGNRQKDITTRGEQSRTTKAAPSDTGTETVTDTEVTERDEQGNPVKARRTTVKKPLGKVAPGMIRLKAPDGSVRDVPIGQKDHYIKLGAKEVKE